LSYLRGKDIKSKIQNNLNRKVTHIKIKADEPGMDAILSKTAPKNDGNVLKTVEVGKQPAVPKLTTQPEKKFMLRAKNIENE
jgi:hypothetical protein